MSNPRNLGKICSMAKKGTIIRPKKIPGYITPEGQVLTEPNQHFNFEYKPIEYRINYVLDGGNLPTIAKYSYTIEDKTYIPPTPSKPDYKFMGWEPKQIDSGSMGDITFVAQWKPNAILVDGSTLNKLLTQIAFIKEDIMAIKPALTVPNEYINISSTSTPILCFYEEGIIYIYSKEDIYCNLNMQSAFEGMTLLRDISGLSNIVCLPGTNINSIFKNCKLLFDVSPIANWANNGQFSDYEDALEGTPALESGRIPKWYKWPIEIKYISKSGKCLGTDINKHYPGEVIALPIIEGYRADKTEICLSSKDLYKNNLINIIYTPKKYNINYELNGGFLVNNKEYYTVEDETYIPPTPYRNGYTFDNWSPVSIEQGTIGDITFWAQWAKEDNSIEEISE